MTYEQFIEKAAKGEFPDRKVTLTPMEYLDLVASVRMAAETTRSLFDHTVQGESASDAAGQLAGIDIYVRS